MVPSQVKQARTRRGRAGAVPGPNAGVTRAAAAILGPAACRVCSGTRQAVARRGPAARPSLSPHSALSPSPIRLLRETPVTAGAGPSADDKTFCVERRPNISPRLLGFVPCTSPSAFAGGHSVAGAGPRALGVCA